MSAWWIFCNVFRIYFAIQRARIKMRFRNEKLYLIIRPLNASISMVSCLPNIPLLMGLIDDLIDSGENTFLVFVLSRFLLCFFNKNLTALLTSGNSDGVDSLLINASALIWCELTLAPFLWPIALHVLLLSMTLLSFRFLCAKIEHYHLHTFLLDLLCS